MLCSFPLLIIIIVFRPWIYVGMWALPKTALDLVNLGPQSTGCNIPPCARFPNPESTNNDFFSRLSTLAAGLLARSPSLWSKAVYINFEGTIFITTLIVIIITFSSTSTSHLVNYWLSLSIHNVPSEYHHPTKRCVWIKFTLLYRVSEMMQKSTKALEPFTTGSWTWTSTNTKALEVR